jgi:hypothetical protein
MKLTKLWKLAVSYGVPAGVFATLLCSAFFSEVGLLEKWVLGDNTIRQIVSSSPAQTQTPDGNQPKIDGGAGLWSNNGHHAEDGDSLKSVQFAAKVCFNQTTLTSVQKTKKN